MEKEVWTPKDVMKRYQISRTAADALFHSKDFPSYRVGRLWFVEKDEMLMYLKENSNVVKG